MIIRSRIALLAYLAFPFVAYGQDLKPVQLNDSSAISVRTIDPRLLPPDFLTMSLLPSRTESKLSPTPLYLSLSLSSSSNSWGVQRNLDLSVMWQNEILKQEKYKTIRTILGSIEAGGVAYLAYLHIKKYGFK